MEVELPGLTQEESVGAIALILWVWSKLYAWLTIP